MYFNGIFCNRPVESDFKTEGWTAVAAKCLTLVWKQDIFGKYCQKYVWVSLFVIISYFVQKQQIKSQYQFKSEVVL